MVSTKRIVLKKKEEKVKTQEKTQTSNFKTLSERFESYKKIKKTEAPTKQIKKQNNQKKPTPTTTTTKSPKKLEKQKKIPPKKKQQKVETQENLDKDLEEYFTKK